MPSYVSPDCDLTLIMVIRKKSLKPVFARVCTRLTCEIDGSLISESDRQMLHSRQLGIRNWKLQLGNSDLYYDVNWNTA